LMLAECRQIQLAITWSRSASCDALANSSARTIRRDLERLRALRDLALKGSIEA